MRLLCFWFNGIELFWLSEWSSLKYDWISQQIWLTKSSLLSLFCLPLFFSSSVRFPCTCFCLAYEFKFSIDNIVVIVIYLLDESLTYLSIRVITVRSSKFFAISKISTRIVHICSLVFVRWANINISVLFHDVLKSCVFFWIQMLFYTLTYWYTPMDTLENVLTSHTHLTNIQQVVLCVCWETAPL